MKLKTLKNLKAEDLHNFYLEAVKELKPESFNPNANKPYSEMTEEQKFIDKFILEKIFEFYRAEAVKWVKKYPFKTAEDKACVGGWIIKFFNLTEEDLK
ncbi:MAG TPA: hypothetical protein VMV95_02710 [Bacillota bacterium]|nr:hypothetical protein [Bacillota bacterium]